ncbi:TIGR03089 family protein [Arcanobacterium phocae]|uniref:TIGR03089 family protein n=1 Tax=Arcanobacterium phocae TaxID=131112 RepID=A0A1H2LEC6_9ACTO|nr:TIGR03089 family protein [Arcanobacterium phocae]SDU79279.1 TIGR03089 family protein [Arcanobacterium phocae]
MNSTHSLLNTLKSRGTNPALTWYGPHERIELSGKVVAMHLSKISQYLRHDLGVDSDSHLIIDLPPHWKSILWVLAGHIAGCQVVNDTNDAGWNDVVITATPESPVIETTNLALTLQSLAFEWPGTLPNGYDDAAAAPMVYPDVVDLSLIPNMTIEVTEPPQSDQTCYAVIADDPIELARMFAGAILNDAALVIMTPENDMCSIIVAENASKWDRI